MKSRIDPSVERLATLSLFSGVLRPELEFVRRHGTVAHLAAGAVLTSEGAPGHEFVVVMAGTVCVMIGGQSVTTLGPGDFFGEVSVLDHRPRTATVVALTPVEVLVSTTQEFQRIIHRCPVVTRRVLAVTASRVRTSTARFTERLDVAVAS